MQDFNSFSPHISLTDKVNLEKSFLDAFSLLSELLPLEAITFSQINFKKLYFKTKFIVNKNGFFYLDFDFQLDLKKYPTKSFNNFKYDDNDDNVFSISHSDHLPVMNIFFELIHEYISDAKHSLLVLVVKNKGKTIGNLAFISKADCFFDESHEQKIRILQSYFSLAINNGYKSKDQEKNNLPKEINYTPDYFLVGSKSGLKDVVNSISQLENANDVPVLIQGETGTGKELVANAIQINSPRKNTNYIKVNCGAFSPELLVSELFGHEKGSFTGANNIHKGKFEQANNGTLFLDEIGDLPLLAQVLLLRVLQDGVLYRIGGTKAIQVNVRIIAATNRNLLEMRSEKLFREDLFHRLNVFPIHIPPLRQRTEDIPLLIKHFTQKICTIHNINEPPIDEQVMDKLANYSWPGNIRELENLVERALLFNNKEALDLSKYLPLQAPTKNMQLQIQDLQYNIDPKFLAVIDNRIAKALNMISINTAAKSQSLEDTINTKIQDALEKCNGKIYGKNGAAQALGMKEHKLRYILEKSKKLKAINEQL